MPLTTADIGIQLLMDSTVSLREIKARITARSEKLWRSLVIHKKGPRGNQGNADNVQ